MILCANTHITKLLTNGFGIIFWIKARKLANLQLFCTLTSLQQCSDFGVDFGTFERTCSVFQGLSMVICMTEWVNSDVPNWVGMLRFRQAEYNLFYFAVFYIFVTFAAKYNKHEYNYWKKTWDRRVGATDNLHCLRRGKDKETRPGIGRPIIKKYRRKRDSGDRRWQFSNGLPNIYKVENATANLQYTPWLYSNLSSGLLFPDNLQFCNYQRIYQWVHSEKSLCQKRLSFCHFYEWLCHKYGCWHWHFAQYMYGFQEYQNWLTGARAGWRIAEVRSGKAELECSSRLRL